MASSRWLICAVMLVGVVGGAAIGSGLAGSLGATVGATMGVGVGIAAGTALNAWSTSTAAPVMRRVDVTTSNE